MEFGFNKASKTILRPAATPDTFKKTQIEKTVQNNLPLVERCKVMCLKICTACKLVFKDQTTLNLHNLQVHNKS